MNKIFDQNLSKFSIENVDLTDKRVIINSSLDVLGNSGEIIDYTRLESNLATLRYVSHRANKVLIIGHAGRPGGKEITNLSLEKLADYYTEKLGRAVKFLSHNEQVLLSDLKPGLYLLENIRFSREEEAEDLAIRENFAKKLASGFDIYVNEAFASYRESASTTQLAYQLPSYLGLNYLQEINAIKKLKEAQSPFIAVMGGAKLSDKLETMQVLLPQVDKILVGGAMAYTLLKANGKQIGNSLVEEEKIEVAREMLINFPEKIVLPEDHLIIKSPFKEQFGQSGYSKLAKVDIPAGKIAVDIGEKAIARFKSEIERAATILWNGPMGVFEWEYADMGTQQIALAISAASGYRVVGGGDSLAAISKFEIKDFDHVSTGGGAMLAALSGKEIKPLEAIIKNQKETNLKKKVDTELEKGASNANDSQQADALIVYGTHSGHAEIVAEAINEGFIEAGLNSSFKRVELCDLEELSRQRILILISSTWNVGKLNDHFVPIYRQIMQEKPDWSDKKVGVIGLGDSENYDIFCGAADYLEEIVQVTKMNQVLPTLKIDGYPYPFLTEYKDWGREFTDKCK